VSKETKMTLVLDPPKMATRSTESAAVTLESTAVVLTLVGPYPEADEASCLDPNYWPEGIDYEKWSAVVQPAPASAFADHLDVVVLLDD
jgi:hypothetical protein